MNLKSKVLPVNAVSCRVVASSRICSENTTWKCRSWVVPSQSKWCWWTTSSVSSSTACTTSITSITCIIISNTADPISLMASNSVFQPPMKLIKKYRAGKIIKEIYSKGQKLSRSQLRYWKTLIKWSLQRNSSQILGLQASIKKKMTSRSSIVCSRHQSTKRSPKETHHRKVQHHLTKSTRKWT